MPPWPRIAGMRTLETSPCVHRTAECGPFRCRAPSLRLSPCTLPWRVPPRPPPTPEEAERLLRELRVEYGLDQRVVDALLLEPRQQEVPQLVGGDGMGQPGGPRVPGQQLADAAVAVALLPRRLEQVRRALRAQRGGVQRQRLIERRREGDDTVLVALASGDADLAAVEIDLAEADVDQFAHADAGVEQGLYQDDVAHVPGLPDRPVVATDGLLAGHVREPLRRAGHLDLQLGAQRPEHALEVGVVRPLAAQCRRQLTGLPLRRRPADRGRRSGRGSTGEALRGPIGGRRCGHPASASWSMRSRSRMSSRKMPSPRRRPALPASVRPDELRWMPLGRG